MARIERSALVAFSAQRMFDLINDIDAYPLYMNGCVGTEILESSDEHVVARLDLSRLGVSYSFVTRNELTPHSRMVMVLEEGPFDSLSGSWSFMGLTDSACKVSLDLEFEFSNVVVAKAANTFLEAVSNELVDSLCERAKQVYS